MTDDPKTTPALHWRVVRLLQTLSGISERQSDPADSPAALADPEAYQHAAQHRLFETGCDGVAVSPRGHQFMRGIYPVTAEAPTE